MHKHCELLVSWPLNRTWPLLVNLVVLAGLSCFGVLRELYNRCCTRWAGNMPE